MSCRLLSSALVSIVIASTVACTRASAPGSAADAPIARGSGAMTPEIQSVLDEIRSADTGQLAVSEEDGRFLRVLVAAQGAKSILEIGGASGFSAIWLGLGARETGGRVVSIEYDPTRAAEGAANVSRAGLNDVVQNVHGDAFAEIPKIEGTFDFVFLDAWKPDYIKFFDLVYPRLAPGGVFVAHNVVNKKDDMEPFLSAIQTRPGIFTTIVSPSGEGMSVSYKVR